jgi:hypothetical protein
MIRRLAGRMAVLSIQALSTSVGVLGCAASPTAAPAPMCPSIPAPTPAPCTATVRAPDPNPTPTVQRGPRTVSGTELPQGDWKTAELDGIVIHYVEKHAGDAKLLGQYFKGVHAAFKTEFAGEDVDALMKAPALCHAYLMPERTRFAAPGHASTRTSSGPPPTCEYYFLAPSTVLEPDRCCTTAGEPFDENAMHRIVAHEYAGVFLERYNRKHAGWRFHSAPEWFVQGYEEYLALMLSNEHSRTVTLEKYKDFHREDPARVGFLGVENPYSDGALLLHFLHEEFGKPKVEAVLSSKQRTFGKALTIELGVTPDQLTARWNRWRRKNLARNDARELPPRAPRVFDGFDECRRGARGQHEQGAGMDEHEAVAARRVHPEVAELPRPETTVGAEQAARAERADGAAQAAALDRFDTLDAPERNLDRQQPALDGERVAPDDEASRGKHRCQHHHTDQQCRDQGTAGQCRTSREQHCESGHERYTDDEASPRSPEPDVVAHPESLEPAVQPRKIPRDRAASFG